MYYLTLIITSFATVLKKLKYFIPSRPKLPKLENKFSRKNMICDFKKIFHFYFETHIVNIVNSFYSFEVLLVKR